MVGSAWEEAIDPLNDPDVARAARYLVERHGAHAELRARGRALELRQMGEVGAGVIWEQITAAVRLLYTEKDSAAQVESDEKASDRPGNPPGSVDYELTLIGTSGRQIAVQVMPNSSDGDALQDARGLFGEYPLLAEIIVRRDGVLIARLTRA